MRPDLNCLLQLPWEEAGLGWQLETSAVTIVVRHSSVPEIFYQVLGKKENRELWEAPHPRHKTRRKNRIQSTSAETTIKPPKCSEEDVCVA